MLRSVITGTGCYIPPDIKKNSDFILQDFYTEEYRRIPTSPKLLVEKFMQITGIAERRYVPPTLNTSDIACDAARQAIADSGIDPESLDQIILAHNFGDVNTQTNQIDCVPALASRVKHGLAIKNPNCIPYDILFGCPGWLQALTQADAFFKAGIARRCLVIGAETLSRVLDNHDRDSMIFSDGAGACIIEYIEQAGDRGILSTSAQSHCLEEAYYIYMGKSNFPEADPGIRYMKMKGRKVYEYAISHVPIAMKECLDKSGVKIQDLKKIFIHQANEKMDESMVERLYKLYGIEKVPENVLPMSIHWLGNSSVATIPTLYDLVRKGMLKDHALEEGDVILFASVGAGMNINAVCYRY
jgi:3-oxoacyl-[acyl-carrier-protein] synthase III